MENKNIISESKKAHLLTLIEGRIAKTPHFLNGFNEQLHYLTEEGNSDTLLSYKGLAIELLLILQTGKVEFQEPYFQNNAGRLLYKLYSFFNLIEGDRELQVLLDLRRVKWVDINQTEYDCFIEKYEPNEK